MLYLFSWVLCNYKKRNDRYHCDWISNAFQDILSEKKQDGKEYR